jgi:O-antigen ligase
MKTPSKHIIRFLGALAACVLLYYSLRRPSLLANETSLAGMLVLEVVIVCLWRFETIFFPVTMGCFLLAATILPLSEESFTIRWLFLAVGAFAGFILWMRTNRRRHFQSFHLIALFCVLAAFASASASAIPKVGLLKATSLFLLFTYAASGARFAFQMRSRVFVRVMVIACEVSVFLVVALHFVGYDFLGNQNNIGAFIGVVVLPVLVWGALTADYRRERHRLWFAVALCGLLLYVTACRAAIVADAVVFASMPIALRHPKIIIQPVFIAILFLEIMAVASPSHVSDVADNFTGHLIYKTQERSAVPGLFGSRQSPWDETIAAIEEHPWFGTGFGTSDLGRQQTVAQQSSIYTREGTNREHGSSYLAMVEYVGILGILPFALLLVLVMRAIAGIFEWTRKFGSPMHYGVPFALITLAGLVHAFFEDWLFAAGAYLSVFFWVSAFLLVDLAAEARMELKVSSIQPLTRFHVAP